MVLKITFCLPANSYKTVAGGLKLVYEYSNRLVTMGNDVNLVMFTRSALNRYHIYLGKKIVSDFYVKISPSWFKLDDRIKKIGAYRGIDDFCVPDGDAVIAVGVPTAKSVSRLSDSKGRKYYLVQDHETWLASDEYVNCTYGMGMTNIAVSKWLAEKIQDSGNKCEYLPNPIDTDYYYKTTDITERESHSIGVLYHKAEQKGFEDSYKVILGLKRKYPDLTVKAFGTYKRPGFFPEWIEYIEKASSEQLQKLYNSVRVFLCMSRWEGFGLTGAEAMACGCCLVSTAYEGVLDYAVNGENSILVPIKDVEDASNKVELLFGDELLESRLSDNASLDMEQRSYVEAARKLERILSRGF